MERREIVVIGGGPAGSTTAALLADAGHDVLLLDKARFPREKPCSEYSSPSLVRLLETLGAKDAFEKCDPPRLYGMDIVAPNGSRFCIEYANESEEMLGYSRPLSRTILDDLLLKNAAHKGVEVWQGVRANRLVIESGSVRGVELNSNGDGRERIGARLVVGADGLHSVVSGDLGVRRVSLWPRRLGLVAHYEGSAGLMDHGEMHIHDRGYCGIAPVGGSGVSVGMALDMRRLPGGAGRASKLFEESLPLFPGLHERVRLLKPMGRISGVGPIAHRVWRVAGDGWALVGDAAGFMDPFTGEGIYRAMKGGELLAASAHHAIRTGGGFRVLASNYTRHRREQFRRKSLVVSLVQLCVSYPHLIEAIGPRLGRSPQALAALSAVLGDFHDPVQVLNTSFALNLLRA